MPRRSIIITKPAHRCVENEADGFLYSSRYTGHACCAIFDRAIMLKLATVSDTPLNQHPDLGNTLSDYDVTST